MANVITRKSVLAIMKEVTEGTPVIPSGATDFVALQDDFSMTPNFESLENAELKDSIGVAKSIRGREAPEASMSHYFRASGVVAQAPNFGDLLEAAFGAVSIASTEYDTVLASTTSVIKVNTGEGATFERGEALLIKDATNGYRIRCIDSISGDDLTIGFQVPTAPASGVNLGRAVLYKPADTGHPTLTLWHYAGNGGALQMIAGARVTSMGVEFPAGELINASYSLAGLAYYWDPINILSADRYLDFTDDDGTFAAIVATGFYKDPYELASAIQDAMNATASNQTYTVTYLDQATDLTAGNGGKFKIVGTGTLLSLLWNTGVNTANSIGDKIGFSLAADDTGTGATTGYSSDAAVSFAAPYSPSYDTADALVAKDNEVMLGGTDDYVCFKASNVSFNLEDAKTDILSVCAVTGVQGSVINQRLVTFSISALLEQYQVEKFKNYRSNDEIKFQYTFGQKSAGNWIAGKCGALYVPTCTITNYEIADADGLYQLNLEIQAFVNSSGQGEVYANFN